MFKTTLKTKTLWRVFIFSLSIITHSFSQQLYQDCSPIASKFSWDRFPSNNTQFDWVDGDLTNVLNNIAGSGVNMTFTITGDTNSLGRWQNSSTTVDSPAVGIDANGSDNLQFFTNGFSSEEGVTITVSFSEPVYAVGFDLFHINTSGANGDKFIITAKTTSDSTIFPTFTRSISPTYTTDETTGIVNSTGSASDSNSRVGINFTNSDKIQSITIQWLDCDTCSLGVVHGSGMSGFSFCKDIPIDAIDSDNDGVVDIIDMDDDNDGVTDAVELCGADFIPELSAPKTVTIYIDLDANEHQTTWTLTGPNGFSRSGGPYGNRDEIINQDFTINELGTYLFTINDSSGNGLTSNNGGNSNGRSEYRVTLDGDVIFQSALSPNFGNSNTVIFDLTVDQVVFPCLNSDPSIDDDLDGIVNYKDIDYNTNVSGDSLNSFGVWSSLDFDNDGVPNHLDLDSDGDGCPDTLESTVPHVLLESNVINTSPDNVVLTPDAVIQGPFGINGYSDVLENEDTYNSIVNFTNSYTSYALDNTVSACGQAMITQVTQSASDRWIEITNIHPTAIIPSNAIQIGLFNDQSGTLLGVTPNFTIKNTTILNPGESLLFSNTNATISNIRGTVVASDGITNYSEENDVIVLSRATGNLIWEGRIDAIENIPDNGAKVRIDEVLNVNKTHTEGEWIHFVDDNLNPYRDLTEGGPERHPHDPLFSEIITADAEANILLGLHRIGGTIRTAGVWSNGTPDRSRFVTIQQDYQENDNTVNIRRLKIDGGSKLTMNNKLLVVTDDITLAGPNDEIRLVGNSQLIQTHQNGGQINGSGKLLIDQQTTVASIYRYTYMSSPVNTVGQNTFTIADILKDGTNPTSNSSEIVDINFVDGFDGSATSPISIADYWIYTYASADGTRSNYVQKRSTGIIPQTDGFLMKGTGVKQNYTFAGTPKDGRLVTTIGAEETYLVGNPYASALNSKKFIEDNINSISGTLYFWQHVGEEDIQSSNISGHSFSGYIGGYATRNISMGLAANQVTSNNRDSDNAPAIGEGDYKAPASYIPIGQGFFIGGSTTGGDVVFNNSQREYIKLGDESIFFRGRQAQNTSQNNSRNELPVLKLGMDYLNDENKMLHRQIGISFNPNNSFQRDLGYDSDLFDLNTTDIYWKFPSDESKYVIAGVQEISPGLEIPIEIVMNYNGEISIVIDEIQNINQKVYLNDSVTGEFFDLSSKVNITLDMGTYSERFFLTFENQQTLSDNNDVFMVENSLKIFSNFLNNEIVVEKNIDLSVDQLSLYMIDGQNVQKWNIKDQLQTMKLKLKKSINSGLYIIKVNTDKGVFSKKLLVR